MPTAPASTTSPVAVHQSVAQAGAKQVKAICIGVEARSSARRALPEEAAIAFEVNGLSYAVMMATPVDLADFALGFACSEGLVNHVDDILELAVRQTEHGWLVRLWLEEGCAHRARQRIRLRSTDGSCGLCGLQSLAQVQRTLPRIRRTLAVDDAALFCALANLRSHQPLNAHTGGVHAAAFCDRLGRIEYLREDVGRHNALDKLIGSLASAGVSPASGFFLLTSRCSYELVEKTTLAGCPLLVTVSTATSLAVERARACGLTLIALARSDAMLELASADVD